MVQTFFAIGINYRKSEISSREKISLNEKQISTFYETLPIHTSTGLVILSTCNRTELYGMGSAFEFWKSLLLFLGISSNSQPDFCYQDQVALEHIFRVACRLDSQIIGDLEISGQFRKAVILSKKHGWLHPTFERLANKCLEASKWIKTNTEISKGTSSVSYAVIDHLKAGRNSIGNILIVGTGKFGIAVIKNIREYLPEIPISITNRTEKKAEMISEKFQVPMVHWNDWQEQLTSFPCVVFCTPGNAFSLSDQAKNYLIKHTKVIDLSMPRSLPTQMGMAMGNRYTHIDEISRLLAKNSEERFRDIPQAEAILYTSLHDFIDWIHEEPKRIKMRTTRKILETVDVQLFKKKKSKNIPKIVRSLVHQNHINGCTVLNSVTEFLQTQTQIDEH